MSDDDRYILAQIIKKLNADNEPSLKEDKYFELFSAEQVLKVRGFDLDPQEIKAGNIGGTMDGGVDSFYLFANRKLVRDDTNLSQFAGQQISIELVIIESKNNASSREQVIKNFDDFTEHCLRMQVDLSKAPKELYSDALLEAVRRFRVLYESAASNRPRLSIDFYAVSLAEQIEGKVITRKQLLETKLREYFSRAKCSVEAINAKTLFSWYHVTPTKTVKLTSQDHMHWTQFGTAYICLASLSSFYSFVSDNDLPREHIFESNVRDHAPDATVNKEIRLTLERVKDGGEFWWLNNGITVLASDVTVSGDTFSITDPLVVNGLQTSYEIVNHFKALNQLDDKRTVLVRVIETTDPRMMDEIIKATNSQTKIGSNSLHATEEIHRKIESAMKVTNLFYDRRKNYYRNRGMPTRSIVTITELAQALTAIVLRRPDDARARPTTVVNKHYKQLFSEQFPFELYGKCASILKRVEAHLDSMDLTKGTALNLLFYVAVHATCATLKSARPNRRGISGIDLSLLTDEILKDSYKTVNNLFKARGGNDKAAKGTELVNDVLTAIESKFSRKTGIGKKAMLKTA
jgi:hypothetical protein